MFTAVSPEVAQEVENAPSKGANIALINNFVEWANSLPEGTKRIAALMGEGNPCGTRKPASVYSALSQIIGNKEELKATVRVIKRKLADDSEQVYLTLL